MTYTATILGGLKLSNLTQHLCLTYLALLTSLAFYNLNKSFFFLKRPIEYLCINTVHRSKCITAIYNNVCAVALCDKM